MSAKKRVSYTAEFKLKVVTSAEKTGNRAAGREFNVDESNIRLWRRNKKTLESCKKKQRSRRYGTPTWPALEDDLHHWILQEREKGLAVSTIKIRLKAKAMAREMNLDSFQGGATWCYRFMRRNNLVVRHRTTVGQKLPDDWQEKSDCFLDFSRNLVAKFHFSSDQIFNMDEVPLSFDCPPSRTVETGGTTSIPICTTGNEKTSFTVVLACAASGQKLPPMVIFKRITIPKEKFPTGVEVRCNKKGWMNEEIMISWINSAWVKRKNSLFKPRALLIMDSMKAHLKENVKNACKTSGAKLSIIPGGLTKKLQPLDLGINRSFKCRIRNLWEKWMSDGIHSYTKSGKQRRASYSEVCKWVKEAWEEVSAVSIQNCFRKCGVISKNCENSASENEDNFDAQLDNEILGLFMSDSDSEFSGFSSEG